MDKATFIIFIIIFAGVVLYFVPIFARVAGVPVVGNIIHEPARILYSFDGGGTIQEGHIVSGGLFQDSRANITSFSFDLSDMNLVYAGTAGNGLLISDDGGKNWYAWSDPKHIISSEAIIEDVFVLNPSRIVVVIKGTKTHIVYETMDGMKTVHELAHFVTKDEVSLKTFVENGLGLKKENVVYAPTSERMQFALAAVSSNPKNDIITSLHEKGIVAGLVGIDPYNNQHIIIGRSQY